MTPLGRDALKTLMGGLPLTAELYWQLRQPGGPIEPGFSLDRLASRLPDWKDQAARAAQGAPPGKQVLIFATLRYWLQHTTLLSLTLAGLGHRVSLAFLPYADWKEPLNRFDLRRQNAYAKDVLQTAEPLLTPVSFVETGGGGDDLPADLARAVAQVAYRDTQYTLQVESVDQDSDLYRLRLERDREAAAAALAWLTAQPPDVVVIPNGSILEFGAVYQAARSLNLPTVTYEFGEQRQRVWLAHNDDVMRQDTDALWAARKDIPLTPGQWDQVRAMFAARQGASLWENFARRWQDIPSAGGDQVRTDLGLDGRPIALLATNVIGDSLTLGRRTFTPDMTTWIANTIRLFADRSDTQLVVRIHPGEQITSGPSVAELIRDLSPELPDHIHLIPAEAEVNTYDLVEAADLGLVYTTTVGMEMAMSGLPVIVAGQTHYRGKGFTLDPDTWEVYEAQIDGALTDPQRYRPSEAQVESAWTYAYRFFFEYPRPFPWQLLHMWEELEEWPLDRVLSSQGQAAFGQTFRHLVGEPLDWREVEA